MSARVEPSVPHTLSICCIVRNESRYLNEWLEYHLRVGIQHFYLYDHQSEDGGPAAALERYVEQGLVDVVHWNADCQRHVEWNRTQCRAYMDAVGRSIGVTRWLALIDADEFIVPVQTGSLADVVSACDDRCGALGVNWQMYGTSNIARVPTGSRMIDMLTRKAPTNHYRNLGVKSIVRPEAVARITNPHYAHLHPGWMQVNPNHEPFDGPFSPYVAVDRIRINHYWSRDEHFFETVKRPRYESWNGNGHADVQRTLTLLNAVEDPILRGRFR